MSNVTLAVGKWQMFSHNVYRKTNLFDVILPLTLSAYKFKFNQFSGERTFPCPIPAGTFDKIARNCVTEKSNKSPPLLISLLHLCPVQFAPLLLFYVVLNSIDWIFTFVACYYLFILYVCVCVFDRQRCRKKFIYFDDDAQLPKSAAI